MAFGLFILYVVLSYVHPAEIAPALASYRIAYWVGLAGLAVAIATLLVTGGLRASLQLWAIGIFTMVMAVSLMVADRWLGAPILTLRQFGPSLTIFILAIGTVTSLSRLRVAVACVIGLMTALTLQGAVAYHLRYDTRLLLIDRDVRSEDATANAPETWTDPDSANPVADADAEGDEEWEPPRIRGLGLMHDPNDLAMEMIVALGLIGGIWKPGLQIRSLLLAAAAGALAYGIYLTRSRGGAVALMVVLWRFAAGRIGRIPALVLFVALSGGAMAVDFGGRSLSFHPDESASGRLAAWAEGLEMLKAQPILGVGYGQFLDHHMLTAHNSLVLCFAETGLLGCFFWTCLFVVTFLELHRLKNLPGDAAFDGIVRQSAEGLQLSLIGLLTAAFFLSRTFVPTVYLMVGLSTALAAIVRAADRSVPLPALPELTALVLACELGGIAVVYAIVKLHFA